MINSGDKNLYAIDIETVTQGKPSNEYTDQQDYKLGNVKDAAKIQNKLEEKRGEARNKHPLFWWTGKVVSIAVVQVYGDGSKVWFGMDEHGILSRFTEFCADKQQSLKLIGMTSKNFDFPYLTGRLMNQHMTVPSVLKNKNNLLDANDFFGWSSASNQRGKLVDYAHGIGMEGKSMKGSDIATHYSSIIDAEMKGDKETVDKIWDKISNYNLHDSEIVAEMARRYYGEVTDGN